MTQGCDAGSAAFVLPLIALFVVTFLILLNAASIGGTQEGSVSAHVDLVLVENAAPSSAGEAAPPPSPPPPSLQEWCRHAPAGSCDSRLVAAEAEAPPLTIKKRSTINKLDGTLTAALRLAAPRRRFVLLTFGNLAVRDHLLNFCKHAAKIRASHIVGAVDKAAFELLAAQQTPAYKTPLAFEEYALDGSNSHASSSWKRFASMRTGEVARVVWLGYHVLHTDTDVVWLRDPMPYLMCTGGEVV